jgi:YegS/Rv2252/BmrU family lipid kinase
LERASIIYNPAARTAPSIERLRIAASAVRDKGWLVEIEQTNASGDASELARKAVVGGSRLVIACGGDGTLNEVINGVAGSEAAVSVIRGGMGNVFAKEIGVPRSPVAALRALIDGEDHRFDLGVAGGRYFLLMCGVGFDASIVQRVPTRPKRLLGSTSYALWGAAGLIGYQSRAVNLSLDGDGRDVDLYWLLLGNTRSYGGVINIASEAIVDDGLLDAYVYAGRGLSWAVRTGLWIALRRADRARGVAFQRVHEVEVSTPGVPVQADGEYFGETPMRFSVAPRLLQVRVPAGRARQLLSESARQERAAQ